MTRTIKPYSMQPKSHPFPSASHLTRHLWVLVLLMTAKAGFSQDSVTGPKCAVGSTQYAYTISGNWTNGTTMTWAVVGGTGSASGTPLPQIHVTWSGSGYVKLVTNNPSSSYTLNVTYTNSLTGGTVSPANQSINYNTPASTISCSAPTGGSCSPTYTYQWQSSTDAVHWSNISGATGTSYSPVGNLTATIYYQRMVTETSSGSTAYSTMATVTVYAQLQPGSVYLASQTVNYNTSANLQCIGISGGNGTYTYQWLNSSGPTGFGAITGATSGTYTTPNLTVATYYQLAVTSNGVTAYSNYGVVNVYPPVVAGAITPTSQTINYNTVPGALSIYGNSGGNGAYAYQWQSSTNTSFSSPTNVGTNSAAYSPPALTTTTYYRCIVSSNGANAPPSAYVTVNVYPQLMGGTISPGSEPITYGTSPGPLTLTGVSGGNSIYSYQWYYSLDGINNTQIPNTNNPVYDPGNLTVNTWFIVQTTSNGVTVNSTYPEFTIPLTAGAISPGQVTIASGTSPGTLTAAPATGGSCSGSYGYQWQDSSASTSGNWVAISGATNLTYSPGNLSSNIWYRMQVTCSSGTAYSASSIITIGTLPTSFNYIRTRDLSKPGVTDTVTADGLSSPVDVKQVTTYFDGLGRPIQTVAKQASPLQNDMVTMQAYDPYGREPLKYLPYTSSTNNGNYKTDPFSDQTTFNAAQFPSDQFYYGQTNFEASPLNRAQEAFAPGNSWVGSNRGVIQQYSVNETTDSVQVWTIASVAESLPADVGMYPVGALYKNITTDELGHQVMEYKNMQGQVLLKKVQVAPAPDAGPTGWLNTYYIYDSLANLRFVIQPQAVQWLQANSWNFSATGGSAVALGLCFRYEYDYRKRMIIKKVPGAGETWMVYDSRDRLVMTQDSILRSQQQWLVTRYDVLNRVDSTVLITDPSHYDSLYYHENLASTSTTYPNLSGYTTQLLTQTFFDNYTGISGASGLPTTMATNYSSNGNIFITTLSTSPTYAVAMTAHPITRGLATGTMTKVLGTTSTYLYTENFYDDRARVIQTKSINYTGGVDTMTTQYDFSGKPLRTLLGQAKVTNLAQHHQVVTKMNYDPNFRIYSTYKNIDGAATDQLIDTIEYDELGRLRAKYLGNNVDSLVYSYNIRGWVTGINKNFVAGTSTNWFGMELAYDNPTSVAGTTYLNPTYNGNIAGTIWKSAGDGVDRKYDFTYDNVNRITGAAYLDNKNGSGWNTASMNYTVDSLTYDLNGNILTMNQHGFKPGNSGGLIDQLTYSYNITSNQLSQVNDAVNDTASVLGDFHYKGTKGSYDYSYDGDGNLIQDNNKNIDLIVYNFLNLPQQVHMKGEGNIFYTYDAAGTKLQKQIIDSTNSLATTTLYLDGFQYQRRAPISNPSSGTDTLQFEGHEEGRARWAFLKFLNGDSTYAWQYDFVEKDHLGNTRVLLTQEKDTAQYLCTMNAANRATENALFYNIDSTSYSPSQIPGYPTRPSTDSVARVDGNGPKVGPAIILKVMSGDKIDLGVKYYYNSQSNSYGPNISASNLLNSLASGIVALEGTAHGTFSTLDNSGSSPLLAALTSSIGNETGTGLTVPQAYLNWVLLDDQFNYVSGSNQSGAIQVQNPGTSNGQLQSPLGMTGIPITKSGYLYIYVSNATPAWDVFFDSLSVVHYSGPMLEENHYYPFGLTMAGISDKAVKTQYAENKYRFNRGTELQNKEFNDGTGLELYDTYYRVLDPQLGRWWQIDPKINESESPYALMKNNPVGFNDALGDSIINDDAARKDKAQKEFDAKKEKYKASGKETKKQFRSAGHSAKEWRDFKTARSELGDATKAFDHTQAAIDNYKKFDPEGFKKANNLTYTDLMGVTHSFDIHVSSGQVSNFDKATTGYNIDKENSGQIYFFGINGKPIGNGVQTVIDINAPTDGNILAHEFGHAESAAEDPVGYLDAVKQIDPRTYDCQSFVNRYNKVTIGAMDSQEHFDKAKREYLKNH